mmetsp:Transcript_8311/g.11989  ORF Transcript_8311/g.11989 Transcript_8311/m.11989 type:complete len:136 (-) Transcript_8311:221-628(-)
MFLRAWLYGRTASVPLQPMATASARSHTHRLCGTITLKTIHAPTLGLRKPAVPTPCSSHPRSFRRCTKPTIVGDEGSTFISALCQRPLCNRLERLILNLEWYILRLHQFIVVSHDRRRRRRHEVTTAGRLPPADV